MKKMISSIKKRWEIFKNGGYGNVSVISVFALLFIAGSIILMVGLTPADAAVDGSTKEMIKCVHDLKYETELPTCTEDGYRKTYCTKCEYEEISIFESQGHEIQRFQNYNSEEWYIACKHCSYVCGN